MTSPYLTQTAVPAAAPSRSVGRALLAGAVIAAGICGAVIAGIIALITWSGCFIGCTGTNHAGGAALAILAAASLASGPLAVSGLYRSARWMQFAVLTFVGTSLLALLVLAGS